MIILLLMTLLQDPDPLIEKLRSDDIEERERTHGEIVKLGKPALDRLRKAHESETNAEARARLKAVIEQIEKQSRYGRGAGEWVLRYEHWAAPPMKWGDRQWFCELRGDGTGTATPWNTMPEIYGLSLTPEQVKEIFNLATAADLLKGDFSKVESGDGFPPPGGDTTLVFRCGPHERSIKVLFRKELSEPARKLLELLKAPLDDPSKWSGVGLVSGLRTAKDRVAAEQALRAVGPPIVPNLKWALYKETDGAAAERLKTLSRELQNE